jgi:hypothetical protein
MLCARHAFSSYRIASRVKSTATLAAQETHQVFNQARELKDIDLWKGDNALRRSMDSMMVNFEGVEGTSHEVHLQARGVSGGTSDIMHKADLAEANKPTLRQFDSQGRRIDVIDYHDSYHHLMKDGIEGGTTSYGMVNDWNGNGDAHIVRAGLMYMQNQIEPGHCCPLVMTSAAIPVMHTLKNGSNGNNDSTDTNYWLEKLLAGKYVFCSMFYLPSFPSFLVCECLCLSLSYQSIAACLSAFSATT